MLELYNDRLQDLFVSPAGEAHAQPQSHGQARRVEIKRNRKGVMFAQGAETKEASSAQELYTLFQQACANRHISATSEFSIPCHAAQFKQGPAKWFGLIVLVTVSVTGRQLDTSLLGSEWHSGQTLNQHTAGSGGALFYRCTQVIRVLTGCT